jgi:hypothetical protein
MRQQPGACHKLEAYPACSMLHKASFFIIVKLNIHMCSPQRSSIIEWMGAMLLKCLAKVKLQCQFAIAHAGMWVADSGPLKEALSLTPVFLQARPRACLSY